MRKDTGLIDETRGVRWKIGEILVLAVLLGVTVGAVSSAIGTLVSPVLVIVFGMLGIIVGSAYIVWKYSRDRSMCTEIESVFIIDQDNMVVSMGDYHAGTELRRIFTSAFEENPALLRQWQNNPLPSIRKDGRVLDAQHPSKRLVREGFEYLVLDSLSTHLVDYFNQLGTKAKIRRYERNDIPDVLLANRFLEMFSKDPADRIIFGEDDSNPRDAESEPSRRVVAIYSGSAYYSSFELALPDDSKVWRDDHGALRIQNSAIDMSILVQFNGMNAFISPGYLEHYIGVDDPLQSLHEYEVKIIVEVDVRRSFIFTGGTWYQHLWVDSCVESLVDKFDFSRHWEKIRWPAIEALVRCMSRRDTPQ